MKYTKPRNNIAQENKISVRFPHVLKFWDSEKNVGINIDEYTQFHKNKMWWKCSLCPVNIYKSFRQIIRNESIYCDECSLIKCNEKKRQTYINKKGSLLDTHTDLCKEWNYNKNELGPESYTEGVRKKVWWVCNKGHEWEAIIANRTCLGRKCPYCTNQKIGYGNSLADLNPELAKYWHPTKNGNVKPCDVSLNSTKKIWWQCKNNIEHSYKRTVHNHNMANPENIYNNCAMCPRKGSSIKEIAWLDYLNISKIHRNKTIKIDGKWYKPDAINKKRKIIYEFYGDYYHSNPKIYDHNLTDEKSLERKRIYDATMIRFNKLLNAGYMMVIIWESEWDELYNFLITQSKQ